MKTIAIYYRVSTAKQDEAMQRKAVEEYIEKNIDTRVETRVYTDLGISGSKLERPEFQRMLADCKAGLIDTIMVYKLDRFSRDASAAIRILLELDSAGVAFVSVTQPVLNLGHDNPFRRTMLAAFSEIAEIERETIVARVRSGLEAAKSRGVKLGRPVRVSDEQVTEIKRLRAEGLTLRDIARVTGVSKTRVGELLNAA